MASSKIRRCLIYGLVDPRTLLINYVGMSSTGMFRPNQHHPHKASCKRDNALMQSWTADLNAARLSFEIAVLQDSTAETLKTDERWWIAFGRACGWPLTNLTDGGVGGTKHHPSSLAKMRAAGIAQFHNNEAARERVRQRTLQQMQAPEQRLVRAIAHYRRQGLTEDEAQRKHTERAAKTAQKRKGLSAIELQQKRDEQTAKAARKRERRRIKKRENSAAKRNPLRPRILTEKQRAVLRHGHVNPAAKAAFVAGHHAFFANEELLAAFAEKIRKTWTPERRAAMSAHAKARQSSPEGRAVLAERSRRARARMK